MKAFFRLLRILPIYLWALLLLIMGVSGYWWFFIHDRCTSWTLRHLVKVAHGHRILEARLSGGFDYAPFQTYAVRGEEMDRGSSEDFYDQSDFLQAFNYIRTESNYWPSAKNKHAEAMGYFIRGKLNYGLELLEKASEQEPMNACMLNDLAAGYVARAELLNQPKDLFHALSVIDEAATNEPDKPDIIFNKALILEKLFLWPTARKTWEEFLTIERSPEWQAEARKHIAIIDTPPPSAAWPQEQVKLEAAALNGDKDKVKAIIEKFGHFAYVHALDEMIPQWADSMANNNLEQANKSLTIARVIGDGLVDVQDEHLIKDLVANIDQVVKQKNHRDVQDLIIAHQKLHEGRNLFEKSKLEKSYNSLEIALNKFTKLEDKGGDTLTKCYISFCLYLKTFEKALSIANDIIVVAETAKYSNLLAYIFIFVGHCYFDKSEFSFCINYFEKAINLSETTKDPDTNAQGNYLLSQTLQLLNDNKIWNYQFQALFTIRKLIKKEKLIRIFIGIAQQLTSYNEIKVAKYFYDEAIDIAKTSGNAIHILTGFLYRSEILFKLGNEKAALDDLVSAKSYLNNVSDPLYSDFAQEILSFREGGYKVSLNPKEAIDKLTYFIKTYKNPSTKQFIDQAYIYRAKAHLILGESLLAEADLKSAIEELERVRLNINSDEQRISFFTSPLSPYDEMINLQINNLHHFDNAFDYTEASRARALLDILNNPQTDIKVDTTKGAILKTVGKPLTLTEIQQQIPNHTTLLQYSLINDKLFAFIVRQHQFNLVQIPVNPKHLTDLIDTYRNSIEKHASIDELNNLSQSLYNIIFKPLISYIRVNEKLVIIPDKILHNISFAALKDQTQEKYLLESFTITIAPSASIYISCLQRDNELSNETNKGLFVIGNPYFNRKIFPNLTYLVYSEKEAKSIKELYANSTNSEVVLQNNATKDALISGIARHTIVHYAGHAIMDSNTPLNSKLVLAPGKHEDGTQDDGIFYAHEIYGQKFPYTRLVVLAACKTAAGQLSKGEGLSSLARPFLAAGVPMVVASLWNANDGASEQLFEIFHRQLINGQPFDEALRTAQLELIHSPNKDLNSPIMWGCFVILGGTVSNNKISN